MCIKLTCNCQDNRSGVQYCGFWIQREIDLPIFSWLILLDYADMVVAHRDYCEHVLSSIENRAHRTRLAATELLSCGQTLLGIRSGQLFFSADLQLFKGRQGLVRKRRNIVCINDVSDLLSHTLAHVL